MSVEEATAYCAKMVGELSAKKDLYAQQYVGVSAQVNAVVPVINGVVYTIQQMQAGASIPVSTIQSQIYMLNSIKLNPAFDSTETAEMENLLVVMQSFLIE